MVKAGDNTWFGVADDAWIIRGAQYNGLELHWYVDEAGQQAIAQVTYDFTDLPGTSGAYLHPRESVAVPAQARSLGMWIYGDGSGHWLRGEIEDGTGTRHPLNFTSGYPHGIAWTGWQWVEVELPLSLPRPLRLTALLRLMALDGSIKGRGAIYVKGPRFSTSASVAQGTSAPSWEPPDLQEYWARWAQEYKRDSQILQELAGAHPSGVRAAWGDDPHRSISLSWWTDTEVPGFEVRRRSANVHGEVPWQTVAANAIQSNILADEQYKAQFNRVVLDGLSPGERYEVQVRRLDSTDWTRLASVEVPSELPEEILFLYIADTQASHDFSIYTHVMAAARDRFPELQWVVHGGDVVDQGFSLEQWYRFDLAGHSIAPLPMVAAIGNHDVYGQGRAWFDVLFPRPQNPLSGQYVFSQSFGLMDLIILDTETSSHGLEGQLAWLEDRSQKWTAPWQIAVFHRAPYRSNPQRGEDYLIQRLAQPLERLGIDLVLTAHDHSYMRTFPMQNGVVSSSGTVYVTGGAAGPKFYPAQPGNYTDVLFAKPEPVYTVLSITSQSVSGETWTLSGEQVDRWSIRR